MVDKLLLGRKLSDIEVYLKQLREYSKISLSRYSSDWKTQRVVERTLQMLIELCIDVANHLISDKGMRLPTSYADTFCVLKENKVITQSLFKKLEKMAKFRNIVVHQYEGIDNKIVISILKEHLKDFENFSKAIIKFVRKN